MAAFELKEDSAFEHVIFVASECNKAVKSSLEEALYCLSKLFPSEAMAQHVARGLSFLKEQKHIQTVLKASSIDEA